MREAAMEAGAIALDFKRKGGAKAWQKEPGNPVTEADLAVNRFLMERLKAARPDYGWLSEETSVSPSQLYRRRTWVVDPIDGTRAYMRQADPNWCVAIGLVEEGQAVAGAIFAPEHEAIYEAHLGGGAYRNGSLINVTERSNEEGARLIAAKQMVLHKDWPMPWPEVELSDPVPNATLLRMAFVAEGLWDGVLVLGNKSDWDLAPATVLVHEAGGLATTHRAEPFVFNRKVCSQRSLLAAGKPLHSLLEARTRAVAIPDPNGAADSVKRDIKRSQPAMSEAPRQDKQLLHLVIGGELKDVSQIEFEDLSKLDFVGAYPNYEAAYDAWKSAAQRTVDNAEMRYFIIHAHKLLDPETGSQHHV